MKRADLSHGTSAKVIHKMNCHVIKVRVLDSFYERARGLIGRTHWLQASAVLINPCRAVHTLGMDIALDVVYIDEHFQIVDCIENLQPNQFSWAGSANARSTLELAAGEIQRRGMCPGDFVELQTAKEVPDEQICATSPLHPDQSACAGRGLGSDARRRIDDKAADRSCANAGNARGH